MSILKEIHLIHHTHTDFGYTDLPETTIRLHADYIKEAIKLAQRFETYPEEARFRWTLEVLLPVESFLKEATPRESEALFQCLRKGLLELTAMPCQITPFVETAEMVEFFRRTQPLFQQFRPKVAFQNDINGFPWGLVPLLLKQGVDALWMGINPYAAKTPWPSPTLCWWKIPGNSRILVYLAPHYCEGYFWFHKEEWRRGPVPSFASPWHHAPDPGQIWDPSRSNLKKARDILLKKQDLLLQDGYSLPVVGLQITNLWRMDNDPPFAGLPDFVRAWNDAGYEPRLRLSTCSQFLTEARKYEEQFPEHGGDWQDWWADGVASVPAELALLRKAQRDFSDLKKGARILNVPFGKTQKAAFSELATNLLLGSEHTWGGYASYARPYDSLSVGTNLQKRARIHQCHEDSRRLQTDIIRKSKYYQHLSKTRNIAICNPGDKTRSGWIEIDASALRFPANTARCVTTGTLFPLENVFGPEWAPADAEIPATSYEYPENIWATSVRNKRLYLGNIPPGGIRHFELIDTPAPKTIRRKKPPISFNFDPKRGLPDDIRVNRRSIIDKEAPFSFGALIIETMSSNVKIRDSIARRDDLAAKWQFRTPRLRQYHRQFSHYAERHLTIWSAPIAHRIEQLWNVFFDQPRMELTTTIWLKDHSDVAGLYLSFPIEIPNAEIRYDSLGTHTRFGTEQMTNTCGEFAALGRGIQWKSPRQTITLASPDTPLGSMDSLATRQGRTAFEPKTQRFYSMIANNHWITNFPFLQATKLTVRHIFDFSADQDLESLCGELWAFPACDTSGQLNGKTNGNAHAINGSHPVSIKRRTDKKSPIANSVQP